MTAIFRHIVGPRADGEDGLMVDDQHHENHGHGQQRVHVPVKTQVVTSCSPDFFLRGSRQETNGFGEESMVFCRCSLTFP